MFIKFIKFIKFITLIVFGRASDLSPALAGRTVSGGLRGGAALEVGQQVRYELET